MPFNIAISGLNAATKDLEVTGNNVANAATNGFKESRAEFADVYANSVVDASVTSSGQGAKVSRIAQQFTQGTIEFTSNNLDLAINGEGFFVLEAPDGDVSYTRAGAFSADRDGYVVDHAGHHLQVFALSVDAAGDPILDADGNYRFLTGNLENLSLPSMPSAPNATETITAMLNFNASEISPGAVLIDPSDPTTFNSSTSTTVYDTLGNAHTSTFYFAKHPTLANTWTGAMYVDGVLVPDTSANDATTGNDFVLTFDSNGALTGTTSFISQDLPTVIGATWPGGPQAVTIDFATSTQFGAPFSVNNLSQDGYTSGRLSGVSIDQEGVVFARYTNGRATPIGKVALAKFNNNQGLSRLGDTKWAENYAAGDAQYGEAGTSNFGLIQSGALEASNVDLTEQLVKLITAQRNYQANAQVISTADAITQTVINIR